MGLLGLKRHASTLSETGSAWPLSVVWMNCVATARAAGAHASSGARSVALGAGPTELWRELCLLGHWIVDAVVVRWAALTERFAHRQGIRSSDVLPLLLARPEPERATAQARAVYLAAGLKRCVWSERVLSGNRLAVDHVIPFALWGNNDLWNLLPTHTAINGQKSDKLPAAALLTERREAIVDSWSVLRDAMPEAFDRQAEQLMGAKPRSGGVWRQDLFARMRQAVEETALQRGVERWTPIAAPAELAAGDFVFR